MAAPPAIDIRPGGRTLEQFIGSRARAKFIQGPVGSGKTTALIHSLMVNAISRQVAFKGIRRRKTIVVRNTYKQLIDTVIPSIREIMPEDVWGPISTSGRPRRMIKLPGLEWEWLFYAADKPDDVEDFKSLQASDIWLSEFRYLPREIVGIAIERTGRFPRIADGGCIEPQVMGETNAPSEDHWSAIMSGQQPIPTGMSEADRRMLEKPKGWEFFIQPPGVLEVRQGDRITGYVANPAAENLANLRPGYYDEAIGGKTDEEIRTELLNRPGRLRTGKPVWASFRRDVHVAATDLQPVEGHPILVGQDFGRTPATMFGQSVFGRWLFLDEFWSDNMGAAAYADLLKGFMAQTFPGFKFAMFGDPAGDALSQADDNSPMLVFRARGLRILPAPTNDPVIRTNAVDQLFRGMVDGSPKVLISPRCRRFIAAAEGGYMFRRMQVRGEVYADIPDKNGHSHIADAAQYMVVGGGEGRALLTMVGNEHRRAAAAGGMRRGPAQSWRGRGWGGLYR